MFSLAERSGRLSFKQEINKICEVNFILYDEGFCNTLIFVIALFKKLKNTILSLSKKRPSGLAIGGENKLQLLFYSSD